MLYELFHDKAPFPGRSVEDVKNKIKKNQINFKKDIQPEIKKWIVKMLNIYPKNRPHVRDILADPFFSRYRQMIEDSQLRGESPLESTVSHQRSQPHSSKTTKNVISFNSLRAIQEQDSGNNSLNDSTNNSGNIISIKKNDEATSIKSFHSNNKNYQFNSFKSYQNPTTHNFKKQKMTPQPGQFTSNQTISAFSSDSSRLGSEFQKVNSISSTNSTQSQYVKVASFKKKPEIFKFEVNSQKEANKNLNAIQSKTVNLADLSKKNGTFTKFDNFKKPWPTTYKNNRKVLTINGQSSNVRKFGSNFKKPKSPISFQKKQKIQFHSEQKPVTNFKWQSQSKQVNSKKETPKWIPKKFNSSMYKNSKLGAKLVNSNQVQISGNRVIKSGSGSNRFIRKFPQAQSTQPESSSQFQMDPMRRKLISTSKGEKVETSTGSKVSFRSVKNQKSFSSSFQNQRNFVKLGQTGSTEKVILFDAIAKKKFGSNLSQNQQIRTPHFLKNRPQQSLLKFLEPKIIRKNFNKNQSTGSKRILINRKNFNGTSTYTQKTVTRNLNSQTN